MIKPKKIQIGDTIGVIAPASPTPIERVEMARIALEEMGFKVKMGESCYSAQGYLAGTDEVRAADINNMFADDEVDGIICIRGGYGTMRILNELDYEMIKANPKVFVGFSDITALHIAFNQKCELLTFHGLMVSSNMVDKLDAFSRQSFFDNVSASDRGCAEIQNPAGEEIKSFARGKASGKLTGGNLALIVSLMGTPYEIDTKGKILFIEDVSEKPYRIDRMLMQLKLAGKLDDAAGIVLGDFANCEKEDGESSFSLMEVLEDFFNLYDKPVLYNIKSGHCNPMITLPFGANVEIDGTERRLFVKENTVK